MFNLELEIEVGRGQYSGKNSIGLDKHYYSCEQPASAFESDESDVDDVGGIKINANANDSRDSIQIDKKTAESSSSIDLRDEKL